jgi:hypothetical protein
MLRLLPQLLFVLLIFGCEDKINANYGPCKFPSAQSKFPELKYAWCKDCFVELNFQDQQYRFNGNQIETIPSAANWNPPELPYLVRLTRNSFFELNFISPLTVQELSNAVGNKTALLKTDTLSKLTGEIPPASVLFGVFDYCREFHQPVAYDITSSSHELTGIELIESYPVEVNYEPYQLSYFYCTGKLNMTFLINGNTEPATAQYNIQVEVYEKL